MILCPPVSIDTEQVNSSWLSNNPPSVGDRCSLKPGEFINSLQDSEVADSLLLIFPTFLLILCTNKKMDSSLPDFFPF